MSALLTQSPGDTVQTETGKVDPARKFKCTTAARAISISANEINTVLHTNLFSLVSFPALRVPCSCKIVSLFARLFYIQGYPQRIRL